MNSCAHLHGDPRAQTLALFRDVVLNRVYNPHVGIMDGKAWPPEANALSMAGQRRLDSFSALVATAVEDGISGDLIETGVWRGGASFVAAKTLELLGERAFGRRVYLADSFRGIPRQDEYMPAGGGATLTALSGQDRRAHTLRILNNNSADRVRQSAALLGLDSSRLEIVEGYFNNSLPQLLAATPDVQFAVVRLDGDTYKSTYETIRLLYPRLAAGGFLIVDDYLDWASCRRAVDEYRDAYNVTEEMILVPHLPSERTNGAYWRKRAESASAHSMTICAACPQGALRPVGALLSPGREVHARAVRTVVRRAVVTAHTCANQHGGRSSGISE